MSWFQKPPTVPTMTRPIGVTVLGVPADRLAQTSVFYLLANHPSEHPAVRRAPSAQFIWHVPRSYRGAVSQHVRAPGFAPYAKLLPHPVESLSNQLPDVTLTPLSSLIEGQWFVRGGKKTPLKGHNDFALLKRFKFEGPDACRPVIAQRKAALGSQCVLKVGSMGDWFGLFPLQVSNFYDQVLPNFLDFLRDEQVVCELVAFVRAPYTMPTASDQDVHWARVSDIMRAHPGHLLKLINERSHWTNEIKDWRRFKRPDGVIASHGSELSGEYPVADSWDYASMHGTRGSDWPEGLVQQLAAQRVISVPVIDSEILGADETYQPGRRSNSPPAFRRSGEIGGRTAGMWLMTQASLLSVLWGPVQEQCAREFGEGFDMSAAGLTPAPELPPLTTFGPVIPPRTQEIVIRLHEKHPVLANGSEDQRRELTVKICEQLRFELGDSWGHKRADPGRPPSKDGFAQRQPDGKIFSWDWQHGQTRQPLVPPTQYDISTQVFIQVEPVNHLGL